MFTLPEMNKLSKEIRSSSLDVLLASCADSTYSPKIDGFGGAETSSTARAKFIFPEMNKLSKEIKSGSLDVLLVSCADS
ncbi:hypothetical protein Hdeb2414_s0003g00099081 [Helianthus debilis subsp. tardiflorus]